MLFPAHGRAAVPRVGPLDTLTSGLASVARLQYGVRVSDRLADGTPGLAPLAEPTPSPALTLFEFEACPFCRRVREVVTYLDLVVTIVPCARGSRHRAEVLARGGKAQFPFLVDDAHSVALYESADIIEHLLARYGAGSPLPSADFFSPLSTAGAFVPTLLRAGRGARVSASAAAVAPPRAPAALVLYSYEGNQFCRLVREVLCELDLPYELRSVGKGSRRRAAMAAETGGSTQCPRLVDRSTGRSIEESAAIVSYLAETYAARAV
ncbi:hypothetical protein KFE25_011302 [Diacronema lutheri]|mgnify:CR=1 FL=1|uniref:GST N-terminal domain-containing protein n=1 Tax=Diacronema lutheri TaxID=2081491 RepID=A0A8J6C001_DIALT|nr:hypothetical protein KFE25_011302 [Diacronema lutheri]